MCPCRLAGALANGTMLDIYLSSGRVGSVAVKWDGSSRSYALRCTHQECWRRFAGVNNGKADVDETTTDGARPLMQMRVAGAYTRPLHIST